MVMRTVLAALLLASTPIASAQEPVPSRSVWVNASGGFTLLQGVGDAEAGRFGNGWNVGMGFVFPVTPTIAVQADFLHTRVLDLTWPVEAPVAGSRVAMTASHFMEAGTIDLRYAPARSGRKIAGYALAGGGIYYRKVSLTSAGSGLVTVCNPWWFVCTQGAVPIETVVGRRNSVNAGINAGGGVMFALTDRVAIFVEARVHAILGGPSYAVGAASARPATGRYIPITVGFRF